MALVLSSTSNAEKTKAKILSAGLIPPMEYKSDTLWKKFVNKKIETFDWSNYHHMTTLKYQGKDLLQIIKSTKISFLSFHVILKNLYTLDHS
jgi:hypothetical protein